MDEIQTVVVGAGVVGIAVARNLVRAGHEVLLLETENRIAQHTSSRNSQVIHAGIYYTPGSWRAKLCVSGKQMLYDYCADRHVPFENIQKLIVAAGEGHLAKMLLLAQQYLRTTFGRDFGGRCNFAGTRTGLPRRNSVAQHRDC